MNQPSDQALLNRIINCAMPAAHEAVIGKTFRTHAELTRAAVTAAFQLAAGNGLIRPNPQNEWPEYLVLDPPYYLPGCAASPSEERVR